MLRQLAPVNRRRYLRLFSGWRCAMASVSNDGLVVALYRRFDDDSDPSVAGILLTW